MEYNRQSPGKPEIGYWLDFVPPAGGPHEFCGPNRIPGAECPNCGKPLLKLASLSALDPALDLDTGKFSRLPLLYCWTCAIPYGDFRYKVHQDRSVEILSYLNRYDDAFGSAGPYESYSGNFPASGFRLKPQSRKEQLSLRLRFDGAEEELPDGLDFPRHQIGGFPMIYNPQADNCPECGAEMPFFASIADNALGNGDADRPEDSFTDNSGVQTVFLLCRDCAVVSAYHSCD